MCSKGYNTACSCGIETADWYTLKAFLMYVQAQEGLSCMMFVELLFWKNSREAMDVRNEYHWKVSSGIPAPHRV